VDAPSAAKDQPSQGRLRPALEDIELRHVIPPDGLRLVAVPQRHVRGIERQRHRSMIGQPGETWKAVQQRAEPPQQRGARKEDQVHDPQAEWPLRGWKAHGRKNFIGAETEHQ
jgi:hypothetical protein